MPESTRPESELTDEPELDSEFATPPTVVEDDLTDETPGLAPTADQIIPAADVRSKPRRKKRPGLKEKATLSLATPNWLEWLVIFVAVVISLGRHVVMTRLDPARSAAEQLALESYRHHQDHVLGGKAAADRAIELYEPPLFLVAARVVEKLVPPLRGDLVWISVFSAALLGGFLAFLAMRYGDVHSGLAAALVYGVTPLVSNYGAAGIGDPYAVLWLVALVVLYLLLSSAHWVFAGTLALFFATMTSYIGVLSVLGVLAADAAKRRSWPNWSRAAATTGIAIFGLVLTLVITKYWFRVHPQDYFTAASTLNPDVASGGVLVWMIELLRSAADGFGLPLCAAGCWMIWTSGRGLFAKKPTLSDYLVPATQFFCFAAALVFPGRTMAAPWSAYPFVIATTLGAAAWFHHMRQSGRGPIGALVLGMAVLHLASLHLP